MSADANNNTSVAPQGEPNGQQDAPDWDSYEIGEKEIRAVFDAVFYVGWVYIQNKTLLLYCSFVSNAYLV